MKTLTTMASAALLAACAHPAPVKEPSAKLPTLSIPVPIIASVCDQAHTEQGEGHFDGHAELLWAKDGSAVIAVGCSLTVFVDALTTTEVRIYLTDTRAQALRDFLATRGVQ